MSCEKGREAIRTIFFNGPKGHRWVTTTAPTDENPPIPPPSAQTDDRAADRRRFFGFLNAIRAQLDRHGVSAEDVRGYYAKRFAANRNDTVNRPNLHSDTGSQPDQKSGRKMSTCSQREWAIAAAEVQAMFQSPEIFADRIAQFKAQKEEQCPAQRPAPSKSDSTTSCNMRGIGANGRSLIGYMLLPLGSRTSTHSAFPSPLRTVP